MDAKTHKNLNRQWLGRSHRKGGERTANLREKLAVREFKSR